MSAALDKRSTPKRPAKQRTVQTGLTVAEALGNFIGSNAGADIPADAARRHKFYLHAAIGKKHSR